jgi:quercetin dioxygenase-like cupin family protein
MAELEAVREREPEPRVSSYEWRYSGMANIRKRLAEGKIVIHGKDRPWEVSPQSRGKYLLWPQQPTPPGTVDPGPPWPGDWAQTAVPNWAMFLHDIRTTADGVTTSGQHRHQGGLGLFIVEGTGYSIVNGTRYDWQAGDFQLLPIVPGGCVHQHFATWGTEAMWLAISWDPFSTLTGRWVEQLKVGSLNVAPPKWTSIVAGMETAEQGLERIATQTQAAIPEPETGLYGGLIKLRNAERERLKHATMVVEGATAPVEVTPMGTLRWYTHPLLDAPALKTYTLWVQDIAPGSRSGRMLHQGGRIHYVWRGSGYTVVDGVRHEWEAGDVICIPIKAFGVEYQHFNTGSDEVKLITVELNMVSAMGVELGVPSEIIEPAPEYRPE